MHSQIREEEGQEAGTTGPTLAPVYPSCGTHDQATTHPVSRSGTTAQAHAPLTRTAKGYRMLSCSATPLRDSLIQLPARSTLAQHPNARHGVGVVGPWVVWAGRPRVYKCPHNHPPPAQQHTALPAISYLTVPLPPSCSLQSRPLACWLAPGRVILTKGDGPPLHRRHFMLSHFMLCQTTGLRTH